MLRPWRLPAGCPSPSHALVNRQVRTPPRRRKRPAPRAVIFGRSGSRRSCGRSHASPSHIVFPVNSDLTRSAA